MDTQGCLISAKVSAADETDASYLPKLLQQIKTGYNNIKVIFADMGYQRSYLKEKISSLGKVLEIVKRPIRRYWIPEEVTDIVAYLQEHGIDTSPGFKVLPKRWIVERTFAWISKYRRFSKDYEYNCNTSETLISIAMSRNYLRHIAFT